MENGCAATKAFDAHFAALTGFTPLYWQKRLFDRHFRTGKVPSALDLPTGLGKTSVMAIWLVARALGAELPRRLVYVVDRRAVVDQATTEAEKLRKEIECRPDLKNALGLEGPLPISTLRGQFVDNREWLANPAASAIIVGTVDMIGSRLLFSGYGVSPKMRPYHAGLLGTDSLIVLDEAHLVPPFQALIEQISRRTEEDSRRAAAGTTSPSFRVPPMQIMALSATGRGTQGETFKLEDCDIERDDVVHTRVEAPKWIKLEDAQVGNLGETMATRAQEFAKGRHCVLVFCNSRKIAQGVFDKLDKDLAKSGQRGANLELIVGERRVREREALANTPVFQRFARQPSRNGEGPAGSAFLVATSAGEVGIDIDADHMVCDLVAWERMVQRLGRVNRRGEFTAGSLVDVFVAAPDKEAEMPAGTPPIETCRKPFEDEAWTKREDGRLNASPAQLLRLRNDADFKTRTRDATTGEPLRPALAPALVDAWAMTSLDNHPGRPEVAPWIRGWIDEETPQCEVLWRRHLPIREDDNLKQAERELKAFFEVAPPHLSEILETEAYRVVDVLRARAKALLKKSDDRPHDFGPAPDSDGAGSTEAGDDDSEGAFPSLFGRTIVGVVLDRDRSIEELFRLSDLQSRDPKRLQSLFAYRRVVLDARLGGLAISGLLDAKADRMPATLDGEPASRMEDEDPDKKRLWSDQRLTKSGIGFRVRRTFHKESEPEDWRIAYQRFVDANAEEEDKAGQDEAKEWRVEEWVGDGVAANEPSQSKIRTTLSEHHDCIERWAAQIAENLRLPADLREMLITAARHHDCGKARIIWQRYAGNPGFARGKSQPLAKFTTYGDPKQLKVCDDSYRHEFGSVHDAIDGKVFEHLPPLLRTLGLRLIAAHHGYARPSIFAYDELHPADISTEVVLQIARDFGALQAHWGPWGLAWWESMLRAADVAASRERKAVPPEVN